MKYTIGIYLFMWNFKTELSLSYSGGFLYCLQVFVLMIKMRRYQNGKKVHFTLAIKRINRVIKFFLCILSRELGG